MSLPSPGIGTTLLCALLAFFCWSVSRACIAWRGQLGTSGWIPEHLESTATLFRTLSLFLFIGCAVAALPPVFDPLLPVGAVAFILVVAWSQRENVRDLSAGWVLRGANTIKAGDYIRTDTASGRVRSVGLRTTTLENENNERLLVSNRTLITEQVTVDRMRWPATTFIIHTRETIPYQQLHNVLNGAAARSPWAAPLPVQLDTTPEPNRWLVRARAIDLQFCAALRASLMDELHQLESEKT